MQLLLAVIGFYTDAAWTFCPAGAGAPGRARVLSAKSCSQGPSPAVQVLRDRTGEQNHLAADAQVAAEKEHLVITVELADAHAAQNG